jgi:DNA modification methylase
MKHYHKNPRKITKAQAQALKRDLRVYGDLSGIVHNVRTDELIGGNQRSEAIEGIISGILQPVIVKEYDEPTEAGTLAIGFYEWHGEQYSYRRVDWDEKTAELANLIANKAGGFWDWDILANDFEVETLFDAGFSEDELLGNDFDLGLDESMDAEPQIDRAAELLEKWGVKLGDLWQLGTHKLICGDCTDPAVVERVMGGEKAGAFVTDPPYNISKDTWDTIENYVDWCKSWFSNIKKSPAYIFTGSLHSGLWWQVLPPNMVYCWHKPNGQGNNPARGTTKWEPILSWNTVQDKQTDFIEHNNEYGEKINTLHLTPKPIGLIEKIIKKTDGIIVDLFLGSGTTMLASQNLSRQCRAVEISPEYCSVILERMSEAFPALEIKRIE